MRRGDAVTVKGGVALRLFYGSPRYSEDIDLDGDPAARLAIRESVKRFFTDDAMFHELKRLKLRGLDPKEGPNKDSEATFRYKFHVLGGGDVGYPTKIEVSFREPHPADARRVARADPRIVERYLGEGHEMKVPHYSRPSAVRQKLEALEGRSTVQARDIFDLGLLTAGPPREDPELVKPLAEHMTAEQLQGAYDRVFLLEYSDYEGQVVEFLPPDEQADYRGPDAWERLQLRVAFLIEAVQKRQRGSDA